MPTNILSHLRSVAVLLKNYLIQLNLFYTGVQDEQIIQNERRSTRLYLVLFILSTIITTFYYTIIPHTETILIKSPSFTKYSTLAHQSSLQCPCSKIAIAFEEFIQIEPFYHELCRSNFITDNWINHLFSLYEQSWNSSISSDFRRIAVFQFQTIRSLCQLAKDTNNNSIQSFLQQKFIQPQLISPKLFQLQMNSFIVEFIDSSSKALLKTLHFIQNITAQSLLMTGGSLTSVLPWNQPDSSSNNEKMPFIGMIYTFTDGSTCTCSSSTATTCMGTATFGNDTVHGFQTGCYMLSALFKSTLEILYNQSFLDKLTHNSSKHFQKLNSSVSNLTIEILLNRIFVDHWLNTTSYERYFNACASDLCQYILIQRYDFLDIIILMVGLFGGLSSALNIIVPFIIMTAWPIVYKFSTRKRRRINQIVPSGNTNRPALSIRLKTSFRSMKQKMIELNLFKSIPPSQDQNIIRQQHYSTRVYFILLIISLSILILFTSFTIQTITITSNMPTSSEFIDLYGKYPMTLNCPCNQTTIQYKQLIFYIKPQYHEICSSEYVSPNWINLKFVQSQSTRIFIDDIRSQLQTHFQLLSTLCQAAKQIIEDDLEVFYQKTFISQQVLPRESFQIQIDLIVEQFKRTIPHLFQNTLELMKANQDLNQFIVPMNSYFPPRLRNYSRIILTSNFFSERPDCFPNSKQDCLCFALSMSECYVRTKIRNNSTEYIIPGMFLYRFPLESLLMSTLECLYDDSCLSQIKAFINTTVSPTNFTTFNLSSEYNVNNSYDKIEILANKLFIQSWNNESSFESYFKQCRPLKCQHTYQSRFILTYMITTIIGLIGGLSIVIRLLAPLIVKLSLKIWNYVTRQQIDNTVVTEESSSISSGLWNRFCFHVKFIARTIIELNLFTCKSPSSSSSSSSSSENLNTIRRNRSTTRMYLILLMITLIIILICTSIRQETTTVVSDFPSLSKYEQLYTKYPVTIKCPCTHIAIKYNRFISEIEPHYHQICSSAFISLKWIESLQIEGVQNDFTRDDFRANAHLHFLTILKFCNLSLKTVNLTLSTFYQTDFVTASVISRNDFNLQTEALMEQFKRTIVDQFMQILKLIRITNHGNQLATRFQSNWYFISKYLSDQPKSPNDINDLPVLTQIRTYGADDCSCAIQQTCSKLPDFPHRASNQSLKQTISGFRVGCLPLNTLLQSDLSCLYNQSCLDMMRAALYYSKPVPVNILTYSSSAESNMTIGTMLNQLFVLNWSFHFSFDRYFNECNPQSCQYSYPTKYNRIYVITILIALFGGSINQLHFITACMSSIIFKLYDHLKKKKKNVVVPELEEPNVDPIGNENNAFEITSMPTIITDQLSINPIDQQSEPRATPLERVYLVSLNLLIILVIVVASTIWFIGGVNETNKIELSSTLSTLITNQLTTESTTKFTHTCHMTLKYQVQMYPIGTNPKSLIIDDFNKDSILDLAVTNYGDNAFGILLGNGNGTFQTQQVFSTGNRTRPYGIAAGDFNNDTLLDLAVSLSASNKVAIFYGTTTDDLFIRSPKILNDTLYPYTRLGAIEISDLNNDGLIDLAVCNQAWPGTILRSPLCIYLNTDDDRQFEISRSMSRVVDCNILVAIGDFDKGGKQNDIFVFNDPDLLQLLRSIDNNNTYSRMSYYFLHGQALSVTKGRFNDDELNDLALIFPLTDSLQILLAYGDGTFIQEIYPTASHPTSVTRINFNNDQIDDLAVLSCNRTVTIFLGTFSGFLDRNYLSFEPNEKNSEQCAHSLKVADLNRDGRDDLVFIDEDTHSIGVLLGTSCYEKT